jgi:uncharacterized protein
MNMESTTDHLMGKTTTGFDLGDVAPPRPREKDFLVLSLAPDLSGTCNPACRCSAEATSQPCRGRMSAGIFERMWNFLAESAPPGLPRSIHFGSGEPLLGMERLKQLHVLMSKAQEVSGVKLPEVSVTTNGVLVDDYVADWLAATGWRVKVGIDGPRSLHDRSRVGQCGEGTYDKAVGAIRRLLERCPGRLSVAAVLWRGTDPAEVYEAIACLGVRRIELVPVAHHDLSLWPSLADLHAYRMFIRDFAAAIARDGVESRPTLVRFEERVRRVMGYNNQALPCGAGRNFLGVSPDGGLYPCFRFVGVEGYRLGDLSTGPDPARVAEFRSGPGRPYQDRHHCSRCWAAPLCGGPCFAASEFFGGGDPMPAHCQYMLADAAAAVWLVEHLRATGPERLLSFFPFREERLWNPTDYS